MDDDRMKVPFMAGSMTDDEFVSTGDCRLRSTQVGKPQCLHAGGLTPHLALGRCLGVVVMFAHKCRLVMTSSCCHKQQTGQVCSQVQLAPCSILIVKQCGAMPDVQDCCMSKAHMAHKVDRQ